MAGLEHTWHSSPLAFFASLLAGELAGCLCLVGSVVIPINQHLDSKKAQRNEQNSNWSLAFNGTVGRSMPQYNSVNSVR